MSWNFKIDPKIWTIVADAVVSSVLYFGAKYLLPGTFDDVKFVVLLLQAVFAGIWGAQAQAAAIMTALGKRVKFIRSDEPEG